MPARPLVESDTAVSDAIVEVLVSAGIDTAFCVVGGHSVELIPGFEKRQDDIRLVFLRQETHAAPIAETYGRLTGKPGVFIGQGPWVTGWGYCGIQEALLSSSPMVLLTDFCEEEPHSLHAPYQSGSGHYGSSNLERALGAVCKEVFTARSPAEAVAATQLAIKHAVAGEPGPVAVLSTHAGYSGTVGPDSVPRLYATEHYLTPEPLPANSDVVGGVADFLRGVENVVIIAGNGVRASQAQPELLAFAEKIGAPVATTVSGKGVFPETHPLALGPMGTWGRPTANAAIAAAEAIVVVGSRLGANDTQMAHPSLIDPRRQTLVQIDIEPRNAGWTFPVNYALLGDAGAVLRQLSDVLADGECPATGYDRVVALREELGYFDGAEYDSDATPIHAQRLVGELRRNLPENAVLTADAGENRLILMHFYQTRSGEEFLQTGTGPMGYAIPAAFGAQLAYPDRPVVAVCSDGGFAMSFNTLMAAREAGVGFTTVVMNNHYYGMSLHRSQLYGTSWGTFLGDFDHAAMAEAMGCRGIRVTDPSDLAEAIRDGVSDPRPTVIDVITSNDLSYLDFQAEAGASSQYRRYHV
jgi:acetolactate synthase-1/2/3 large subunit